MDILLLPVLLGIAWKMQYRKNGFREDTLSAESTVAVKGILAVLIVLHHLYQHREGGIAALVMGNVGVLCVALFLFFSGYGLLKSHMTKPGYPRALLRRRIPSLLIPYLLLVLLYWGLDTLLGNPHTPAQVLQSFVSGYPLVAYSWYTLYILVLYGAFWLSAVLFGRRHGAAVVFHCLFAGLWVLARRRAGYPHYWYNAAVAFPLGIFWAVWEQKLLPVLQKHYWVSLCAGFVLFGGCFAAALATTGEDILLPLYWLACVFFVVFVLLVLQKFRFHNPMLFFLGQHSFAIYGIHGVFVRLYRSSLLYMRSDLVWGAAVLVSAVAAAWLLRRLTEPFLRRL